MKQISGSLTKRALVVGLIAAGGLVAATSYAVSADGVVGKSGCEARHAQGHHGKEHHGSKIQAQREEKRSQHMAGLKDKLKLAPQQEAAWNDFVSAAKPTGRKLDVDRQAMRGEFEKLNTPDRLDKMLAVSEARRARMLERTQAIKAFYGQLTPEQREVFDAEAMPKRHQEHRQSRIQS